jgi:hypothetical protein
MDTANKEHEMSEFTFKSWEEYTPLEQAACTYWDMYKDAHGFRPRHVDTSTWTLEQFEEEFKSLEDIIDRENTLRKEREEAASHEFEMRMQDLLRSGAKDRAMALRWVHEAEGSNGDDEYLCFLVGLSYGYFKVVA